MTECVSDNVLLSFERYGCFCHKGSTFKDEESTVTLWFIIRNPHLGSVLESLTRGS